MCYWNWIPDWIPDWIPQKKFSHFLVCVCILQRVLIELLCSSRCSVKSLTDVSFIVVVYGENASLGCGGDFFVYCSSMSGCWGNGQQVWAAAPYPAPGREQCTIYIFLFLLTLQMFHVEGPLSKIRTMRFGELLFVYKKTPRGTF